MTPAAWTATGVAGAALLGGVGFTAAAAERRAALEREGCGTDRPCPDGAAALEQRARAADLMFLGALFAGGVAGVLYYRSDATTLAIEPSAGGLGMSVGGRF